MQIATLLAMVTQTFCHKSVSINMLRVTNNQPHKTTDNGQSAKADIRLRDSLRDTAPH